MNTSPLTLVIPVYNREFLLLRTLESLEKQTLFPQEVILVDNGSTDGSVAVCADFAARQADQGRCVTLLSESKQGANAARNCGLAACKTPYVLFFDSDDTLEPGLIQACTEAIARNSEADVMPYRTWLCDERGRTRVRRVPQEISVATQLCGAVININFVARTSFLRMLGGFDPSLMRWQDWEIGLRILLATHRVEWVTDDLLCTHYEHKSSITTAAFSPSHQALMKTITAVRSQILAAGGVEMERFLRLLLLRETVLAADYFREGEQVLSRTYFEQIMHQAAGFGWFLRLVYVYRKWGGRGVHRLCQCIK